ncbi:hypothetical protein ACLUEY_01170 [Vreelandella aquamarina]
MANEPTSTDINALLDDLDAGIFREKVGGALSAVAAAIVATGKQGKVTITFDMKQIDDARQISMTHKVSRIEPTQKGKRTEENTTSTPLHVGRGGKLSLFPENQGKFDFQPESQGNTQRA